MTLASQTTKPARTQENCAASTYSVTAVVGQFLSCVEKTNVLYSRGGEL